MYSSKISQAIHLLVTCKITISILLYYILEYIFTIFYFIQINQMMVLCNYLQLCWRKDHMDTM